MKTRIRLGTRGSELALWQTEWVRRRLQEHFPEKEFEVVTIKTTGDKILDAPLAKIGDKGLFTKELDRALLDGRIDLAVHSMKDVPTEYPSELLIAAVTERWDPRDVLISRQGKRLAELPLHAVVATGSVRRKAQLLHLRPDFRIVDIRGNLNTRLRKFDQADWDALVLAAAGVERLGWSRRITQKLPLEQMLPAVGQGCFAVMIHRENKEVWEMVQVIHHPEVAAAVFAERALLRVLEGGCQVPLGAYGTVQEGRIHLRASLLSLDGRKYFYDEVRFPVSRAEDAGRALAEKLLTAGAREVLEEIKRQGAET